MKEITKENKEGTKNAGILWFIESYPVYYSNIAFQ
jgi:hypothetical protein